MKTSNWAAITFLTVILTAAGMVWMGWFGSNHHARASAASRGPQAAVQTKSSDIMDSQAAWRYRRAQNPNWKVAMCYHP
jgi:flagellar basal body-associated protein FliL